MDPSELSPTLAENSWKMIARASEEGIANTLWKVGDEIDVVLSGDYKGSITMQIAGFGHDALAAGGKAGITFLSKQVLGAVEMHSSSRYYSGWIETSLRTDILPKIKRSLPDELQKKIKAVLKNSAKNSYGDSLVETVDEIFIPSVPEIFPKGDERIDPTIRGGLLGDGVRYKIFEDTNDPIKNVRVGGVSDWWLRSAVGDSGTYINTAGYQRQSNMTITRGICFGFCI